jgi:hypothetical protein
MAGTPHDSRGRGDRDKPLCDAARRIAGHDDQGGSPTQSSVPTYLGFAVVPAESLFESGFHSQAARIGI